jgi:hypothetical protein
MVQFSVQGLHIVVEESANMSGQNIIFFLQQIQQEPYSFTPHMFRSPILPSMQSFLMKKYKRCMLLKTRGVSHCGLAIYIKNYLNAKEELWKCRYFTMQKYNL